MAFTDDKYTVTFADAQDRSHVVSIFPDGYSGSATAIDPADNPLTFRFGGAQDNEYRIINETVLEIRVVVTDGTVHADLLGSNEQSVAVQWTIDGALAWRGYLLVDDMEQPIDSPGVMVMRAVCGLAYLDGKAWTPASTSRQTFMAGISDALNDLSAHGVTLNTLTHKTRAAANWHAHDPTSASGNSFARYEFDPSVFENQDVAGEYRSARHVIEQLVGRFGAKITNADGRWTIYQRELITGTTVQFDKYDTAGTDEGSNESVADLEVSATGPNYILENGAIKGVRPYGHVPITYAHGTGGGSLIVNGDFNIRAAGADAPTGWTLVKDAAQTGDEANPEPGGGIIVIGTGGGGRGSGIGPDKGIGGFE